MGSRARIEEEKAARERSFTIFMWTGAGVALAGMAFGVHRQLRKEKFSFTFREHRGSVFLAFKALLYGTILCATAFGAGAVAVVKAYDVKSKEEFAELVRKKFDFLKSEDPALQRDREIIHGMSEKQELDYWSSVIEATEPGDEPPKKDGESESASPDSK
jgi:hypothetical protein